MTCFSSILTPACLCLPVIALYYTSISRLTLEQVIRALLPSWSLGAFSQTCQQMGFSHLRHPLHQVKVATKINHYLLPGWHRDKSVPAWPPHWSRAQCPLVATAAGGCWHRLFLESPVASLLSVSRGVRSW